MKLNSKKNIKCDFTTTLFLLPDESLVQAGIAEKTISRDCLNKLPK